MEIITMNKKIGVMCSIIINLQLLTSVMQKTRFLKVIWRNYINKLKIIKISAKTRKKLIITTIKKQILVKEFNTNILLIKYCPHI